MSCSFFQRQFRFLPCRLLVLRRVTLVTALVTFVLGLQVVRPPTVHATKFWKNSITTGNWTTGNNWSAASAAGADNAGVPTTGDNVVIAPTDGNNHNITYDYTGPALALGVMSVDLTGPGTTTTTLSMSANSLTSQGMTVGGSGRGTVQQSGGTVSLTAGVNPEFVLGDTVGSSGTYNLSGSGALLVNASEFIGKSGTGVFNQTGGTNTSTFFLNIGFGANGMGTYTLSGGSATVAGGTFIGGTGSGVLNVSGTGTYTAGNQLNIATSSGSAVNLSGGTINAAALNFNGLPARFNWTGGKLNVTSNVTWDSGLSGTNTGAAFGPSLTLGSNRTLMITGNETLGGIGAFSLTLNSGSTHQVTGALTIATNGTLTQNDGSTLSAAAITQAGGTVNGTLQNLNTFNYQSGSFNGRLINQGTVNLGPSFTAGDGVENDAILVVNSGQTLIASGAGLDNLGTLSLSGGTIKTTALHFHSPPTAFTWTTGTLNVTSTVVWDSAADHTSTSGAFGSSLVLSNNQTLAVSGDETLGGAGNFNLTLNSGSTHNVDGNLTIGPNGMLSQFSGSTLNVGTITLGGGTVNGDSFANYTGLTGHGTLGGSAGFVNLGSITVSGGTLTISNSGANANSGQIDVPAGQQLQLLSGSFDNVGTINLNGGTINGNSFFGNTTGIISGHGTIANLILNSGALVVDAGILNANSNLASNGEIYLAGGLATLSGTGAITNTGLIRGDGVVTKALNNNAGGEIRAESGRRLKLQGASGANAGKINLQGGTAEFAQALTNGSSGQIEGRGTLITRGTGLANQGNVALSSGITDVFGDVSNSTGSATKGITISGNADVTFWDDVTNAAGSLFKVSSGSSVTVFGTYSGAGISGNANDIHLEADVSPGFSPATVDFGGNLHFSSTTRLKIELGGTAPGTEYDQVHVSEQLSLDGGLQISLINAPFAPAAGNAFDILDWGSLSGKFSSLSLPSLTAGLMWNASQLYTTGILSVFLAGDYNGNGLVDAADYTVWRDSLGRTGTGLAADGNGDNAVTQADYDLWKMHFGESAPGNGAGTSANAAVPEPATWLMVLSGILTICCRRRAAVS